MMPLVFELITILAVLGLGFVLGRIWEIGSRRFGRKTKKRASRYRQRTFPPIRPRPSHWVADASSASNLLTTAWLSADITPSKKGPKSQPMP